MSQGVIFIATGPRYVQAACQAAASVKAHCPGLEIDLFCDKAPSAEMLPSGQQMPFDQVHTIATPHRRSKVDYMGRSRFEQTLYLDTDVMVVADIRHLFALLERFDIAMCHAHLRNTDEPASQWNESIPFAFPQLNSGVVLYSRRVNESGFFDQWQQAFHSAGVKKDQVTLRQLLWKSDLRLYVLPPEYNVRYLKTIRTWRTVEARPAVLHMAEFHKVVSDAVFERFKNNWRIRRVMSALSRWKSSKKG